MQAKQTSRQRTRERIETLLLERGALSIQTMYNHLERDGHGKHGTLRAIQELVYDMAREGELETLGNQRERRYKLPADAATAMLPSDPPATPSAAAALELPELDDDDEQQTPSAAAVVAPELDAPELVDPALELIDPDDLQQLQRVLASQGWSHLLEQLDGDTTPSDAGEAEIVVEPPAAIVIGPLAQQIARAVAVTAEHYLQTQSAEHTKVLRRNYELSQGFKRKDDEIARLRAELEQRPSAAQLEQLRADILDKNRTIAELQRKCDQLQRDVDAALATAQEHEQTINQLRDNPALRALFK